jgi:hypothetical protein
VGSDVVLSSVLQHLCILRDNIHMPNRHTTSDVELQYFAPPPNPTPHLNLILSLNSGAEEPLEKNGVPTMPCLYGIAARMSTYAPRRTGYFTNECDTFTGAHERWLGLSSGV